MQVVTLNAEDFEMHASRLAKAVEESSDCRYDAIVGVRRGGSIVCDAFLRHFSRTRYGERYDVELQRPSTKRKGGALGRVLKRLPYLILDFLRMTESYVLAAKRKTRGPSATPDLKLPEGLVLTLTANRTPKILVIDDAIDSGDTLWGIVETLRKTNPDAKISTAVMTETTRNPRIRSNHTLYRNRTLIRFPWSTDYKNP